MGGDSHLLWAMRMIIVRKTEQCTETTYLGMPFEVYQEIFSHIPVFELSKRHYRNQLIEMIDVACLNFTKTHIDNYNNLSDAYKDIVALSEKIHLPLLITFLSGYTASYKLLVFKVSEVISNHIKTLLLCGDLTIGVFLELKSIVFDINSGLNEDSRLAKLLTSAKSKFELKKNMLPMFIGEFDLKQLNNMCPVADWDYEDVSIWAQEYIDKFIYPRVNKTVYYKYIYCSDNQRDIVSVAEAMSVTSRFRV